MLVVTMLDTNREIKAILANLGTISQARQSTEPLHETYLWLSESGKHLHPDEMVATVVCTLQGETKIDHLRWGDLVNLHEIHLQLCKLEQALNYDIH